MRKQGKMWTEKLKLMWARPYNSTHLDTIFKLKRDSIFSRFLEFTKNELLYWSHVFM